MRPLPTAVIGLLALTAGCSPHPPANIEEIDWKSIRSSDVSCRDSVDVTPDYYDLDGDGHLDAFLTMRCHAKTDPPGDQLEVVAGDADPSTTHPTKLVMQMPQPAVVDRLCFAGRSAIYRVTVAGKPSVWQVRWSKGAVAPSRPTPGPPHGCP